MNVAERVALARERFLTAGEPHQGDVRESILASWRRSRFWEVDVDRIEPPYRADVDLDNRLVRSARPVLDRLERELSDAPMSVILTDAQAWVLERRVGDRALYLQLDKVSLAPGFNYAERFIGTNGIGTALEEQRAAHVFGHEHFSERLQTLSCAGAVVRHPLTGRVEGLIDLTGWRVDAGPLMRVLAGEAARDVARRLAELDSERERALLQEFLATCRRTRRPLLSLNDDLVITNARGHGCWSRRTTLPCESGRPACRAPPPTPPASCAWPGAGWYGCAAERYRAGPAPPAPWWRSRRSSRRHAAMPAPGRAPPVRGGRCRCPAWSGAARLAGGAPGGRGGVPAGGVAAAGRRARGRQAGAGPRPPPPLPRGRAAARARRRRAGRRRLAR
jgi:hypothetical protein